MNNHEFRTVVKELDSATIKKNNINPAHFKAVCWALSMYGDYKSGTRIKPSWLSVARDACVDRKTAMKVRDYLLAAGIIFQVSKTEANISVYEFSDDYDFQLSIKPIQLSIKEDQLSNIDGHNSTIDITYNSKRVINNKPGEVKWNHSNLHLA
jgi:hypothetical protein